MSSEVRAAAVEDLDRLSIGSQSIAKKKQAPRNLKPLANKTQSQVKVPPAKASSQRQH